MCDAERSIVISFPDPHDFYDPLEDFTSFIDSMGLALDSESLVDLRSIPLEHAPLSNVQQADDYHTRVSQVSGPDYDEEQSEGAHRAQSPTLLPIPLNPAGKILFDSSTKHVNTDSELVTLWNQRCRQPCICRS